MWFDLIENINIPRAQNTKKITILVSASTVLLLLWCGRQYARPAILSKGNGFKLSSYYFNRYRFFWILIWNHFILLSTCGNLSNVLYFPVACVIMLRHYWRVKSTIGYIAMFSLVIVSSRFLLQSMEIVGIRDTEIHSYQINLKGSGSSRITKLPSNTKNGAKFR